MNRRCWIYCLTALLILIAGCVPGIWIVHIPYPSVGAVATVDVIPSQEVATWTGTPAIPNTPSATATPNRQMICNVSGATYNIRSSPQVGVNVVGSLAAGGCVEADNPVITLVSGGTRWVQVFVEGDVGWISAAAFGDQITG
jgi:hypothetical protein